MEARTFREGSVWVSDDEQGVAHVHFIPKGASIAGAQKRLIMVAEREQASPVQIRRTRFGVCAGCAQIVPADDSYPFAATSDGRASHMKNCKGIGLPTGPVAG